MVREDGVQRIRCVAMARDVTGDGGQTRFRDGGWRAVEPTHHVLGLEWSEALEPVLVLRELGSGELLRRRVRVGEHLRLCVVDGNARFDLPSNSITPVAPG